MPPSTDNFAVAENESHSDSDWLDVASTDRDSDDNDSIYSSRETDHEDPSRSRSRRSSLSYGSSRDGDVDGWEGLIEDSADEHMSNDVLAPRTHVASPSQHLDLDHTPDTSPEELRVQEGLDQSMISTLSSSRSSSLHASTIHNSSRDLRLSFPDPITSSCREPLSTSYEEIQPNTDLPSSPVDSDVSSDPPLFDEEDMTSASQMLPVEDQATVVPPSPGPELKVFLYGYPTVFKWSIVDKLVQKVVHGAGLTINSDLENLQSGPVRRLAISGSFERDHAFPRTITVLDRTLQPYDIAQDLALMDFSGVRPLAVVFMPCRPPDLPGHVLCLPVVLSSYASELGDFGNIPQRTWDMLSIPDQQILRISAPDGPRMIDKDSIDTIDSTRAYRAFSRLWSGDNVSRVMAGTHALTIIAILSLILGLVVRAALPVSLQQFTPLTFSTLAPNYTGGSFWQAIRPAPHRERLPSSTTLESSVVVIPSSFKDFSLSVFSAESTSVTLARSNPTDFRRMISSSLSERPEYSKALMLQPPCSVLPPDNRPKALSVIPDTSPTLSYPRGPDTTGLAVSTLTPPSVTSVVKECASVVLAAMNQDMQDIFDALDALVQAISRQTQMILAQASSLIEQSTVYWEKSVESFEMVKETLHVHNGRARKRAKEIRERGTKWLYEASEVVTTSAWLSGGMAWELAEGLAYRAQRARGKAKEIAAEIQDFLIEQDKLEVFGVDGWDLHAKQWEELVRTVRKRGMMKSCKRKAKSPIFC